MVTVSMPQLGETVTEGTVTALLKAVGDRVATDEALLEISTEKVDSEIPSPVDGVIGEILVAEGDTIDIGQPLLVITADGDAPTTAQIDVPSRPPEPDRSAESAEPTEADRPTAPIPVPVPDPVANGDGGTVAAGRRSVDGGFLSPAVRRLVAEHDLDPATVHGTGAGGRISVSDVEAAVAAHTGERRPGPDGADEAPPRDRARPRQAPDPAPQAGEGETVVPFTPIRRRTAAHMVRSLATSAHTLVVTEVDYAAVERVRQAAKDAFRERHGAGLTYLPFIARAVIDGIAAFPQVNARVGDDELIVADDVNLGVAVDLDFEGLIVPVLRHADRLRLPALAVEMAVAARRARARDLTPADVEGGTFTMTNAGGYGTLLTAPIINQPQVAILATDGIAVHPVAVPQDGGGHALGFHPTGNLCVSFDHRAFDGAYASAFLAHVRDHLQGHDWEAEL